MIFSFYKRNKDSFFHEVEKYIKVIIAHNMDALYCIMEKTDGKNWRNNIKRDLLDRVLVAKVAEVKSAQSMNHRIQM